MINKIKVVFLLVCMNTGFHIFASDSYYDIIFEKIEKQENYYSCGISIAQCLLNHFCKLDLSQSDIMSLIVRDSSILQTEGGVSMLDIKKIIAKFGIQSFGLNVRNISLSDVFLKYQSPIILHYNEQPNLYSHENFHAGHFTILISYQNKAYYILDPNLGKQIVDERYIKKYFSGYCLVLQNLNFLNDKYLTDEMKRETRLTSLYNRKGM